MTPIRGPRRSMSVLVPTVVPWTIEPTAPTPPSAVQAVQEALRLVAAMRRHLGGEKLLRLSIEQKQVGEGAAHIDADDDAASVHAGLPARAVTSASSEPSCRSTTL